MNTEKWKFTEAVVNVLFTLLARKEWFQEIHVFGIRRFQCLEDSNTQKYSITLLKVLGPLYKKKVFPIKKILWVSLNSLKRENKNNHLMQKISVKTKRLNFTNIFKEISIRNSKVWMIKIMENYILYFYHGETFGTF